MQTTYTCDSCEHWKRWDAEQQAEGMDNAHEWGGCHKHAPRPRVERADDRDEYMDSTPWRFAHWPMTYQDDGCSDWSCK